MSTLPLAELLPDIYRLACRAGALVRAIYHHGEWQAQQKTDASPLTQADLQAHDCIVHGLRQLTPYWPILSEEGEALPTQASREKWAQHWLVDPLDGTKEFIDGTGEFTVNIALIQQGKPCLGVVIVPEYNIGYYAATGLGAYRQDGEQAPKSLHTQRCTPPPRVVMSRRHGVEQLQHFLHALGEHQALSVGSSLKLCRIAEGHADLYPRFSPTSEWDIAAAHCILEEAGGAVWNSTQGVGHRLCYNDKPDVLNPSFLAVGDPDYPWRDVLLKCQ